MARPAIAKAAPTTNSPTVCPITKLPIAINVGNGRDLVHNALAV
jgi:hypothetical protein